MKDAVFSQDGFEKVGTDEFRNHLSTQIFLRECACVDPQAWILTIIRAAENPRRQNAVASSPPNGATPLDMSIISI